MPKRKSSRKCNEEPSATRKKVSSTSAQGNRDSMFNEFTRGLGQVAVLTSSPSVEYNRTNEFKNTVMSQLEEEMRIVEAHIVEVFDKLEKNFGRAGKTVYNSSSLGAELPYHEAVVKAMEMVGSNRSAVNPRINTYNSNNSENMPPSTQFRSVRRSMSVEPVGPHTTILSHRPRPSKSCDRLGLLKTPATHGRTFNYGIATVTPHPQLLSQTTNNMTVLRKPNPGEVAISMSGSPLLVRGDGGSDDPSVTVPLADGRVFQVRGPNSPFQEELKKGLSNEAKLKLRELKNFIDKLI